MTTTTVIEVSNADAIAGVIEDVIASVNAQFNDPHYSEVLVTIQSNLEKDHLAYFDSAHDPNGTAWAPLRPSTIQRKGHDTILVDSGALKASLTKAGSTDAYRDIRDDGNRAGLTFGTSVEYAGYHMTGTNKMPARPHTGTNDQQIDTMANLVADHVVGAMSKES